jgi:hypothetical protein
VYCNHWKVFAKKYQDSCLECSLILSVNRIWRWNYVKRGNYFRRLGKDRSLPTEPQFLQQTLYAGQHDLQRGSQEALSIKLGRLAEYEATEQTSGVTTYEADARTVSGFNEYTTLVLFINPPVIAPSVSTVGLINSPPIRPH